MEIRKNHGWMGEFIDLWYDGWMSVWNEGLVYEWLH